LASSIRLPIIFTDIGKDSDRLSEVPNLTQELAHNSLHENWPSLSDIQQVEQFKSLRPAEAQIFLMELSTWDQGRLLSSLPQDERGLWLRALAPDDAVDVLQQVDGSVRRDLLAHLDKPTRDEVSGLLAYREDVAGGLMSPRYARLRGDMSVQEALAYLRRQAIEHVETIYNVYVLDSDSKLIGVTSLRTLFSSEALLMVQDIMQRSFVVVTEDTDQEKLSRLFAEHNLTAIPVVDEVGRMKGIVTIDDIVDVVQEEATEDIQKLGGSEALNAPYLEINLISMIRKRAGWLVLLFLSEMLTANAMSLYEGEIAKAVILAIFIPLIISSGGNSGSQATTLVIRAMALREVKLKDWWRVLRRELIVGSVLGLLLGAIGICRIIGWQWAFHSYGEHYYRIAFTVGLSLIGIVLWGGVAGSMLPFLLRKVGFDPASASAPFVATLVDVTGLVIYFSIASVILKGALL
jgi:magnesium transporter